MGWQVEEFSDLEQIVEVPDPAPSVIVLAVWRPVVPDSPVDANWTATITNNASAVEPFEHLEGGTGLVSAYPDPFGPQTTIAFNIEQAGDYQVNVFDLQGRCVKQLASRFFIPGRYERVWNGRRDDGQALTSGVYFVRLNGNGVSDILRTTLLR